MKTDTYMNRVERKLMTGIWKSDPHCSVLFSDNNTHYERAASATRT